jgi:hypothetical protein
MRALVVLNPRSGGLTIRQGRTVPLHGQERRANGTVAACIHRSLDPERDFVLARLKSVELSAHCQRLRVALDGEPLTFYTLLRYHVRPRALHVFVPEPTAS